jgi:ubiquinone/menaquinone biosynthesis C-methylase UbiE
MPANVVNVDYWNLFQIQPGERVLDLGCGNGRHTIEAANWDCSIVAMDIDREELRRARYMFYADYNAGKLPGFAEFLRGDAEHLPFRDGAFDKIITTEVLEHVFDDERAMRELLRVLRPGGQIAISCPHHRAERFLWWLSWDYWHSPGGHIRIYRKGQLRKRLSSTGFRMGEERGRHAYQSIYWSLRCLFGKDNPQFVVMRSFWRFIEWNLRARNPLFEGIEAVLDRVIPKDFVLYGTRPAE